MCQWKFFVFRYRANTSARIAFIAPEMSFVASGVRSVRVSNGASRLRNSSVLLEFDLARLRPSCEFLFILKDSTSFDGNIRRVSGLGCLQRDSAASSL